MGYNSRLDTIQAVVGNWILPQAETISEQRIANANYLDQGLEKIHQITIPPRPNGYRLVYHLYIIFAQNRDELLRCCNDKGIAAKIHYPVPIYLQPALKVLGHKKGDFPVADEHADKIITFPCDQHLSKSEIDYIINIVTDFYRAH